MRILRALFCALAALTAAGSAAAQHQPPAAAAEVVAAPDARRADIALFRAEFMARDRSFSAAARTEAEQRLTRLGQEADTICQAYFDLELARIVALADNGHTLDIPGLSSRHYNRISLRLAPFGEDFYVLRATEENADLLGARLVAIEGRDFPGVRAIARSLIGGTDGHRDRFSASFFESPEQMAALGVTAHGEFALYRFQLLSGAFVERSLTGAPPNPDRLRATPTRVYFPAPIAGENGQWRSALAPASAPWTFTDPDLPLRWRAAPELGALVIEFRQNRGSDDHPMAPFLAEVRREIAARHPRNIVLDMRLNGGGDLNTTRDFMQSLPNLAPGRIFALTSPWTFSAAISSVGYLRQAGLERVTIVGEMVGDRLIFFAEGDGVTLPNSQAVIQYATQRHDYQTGCRPYRDCHGPVVRHPIAVASLAPDIAAPWTIEAYLEGRDPGMEAVAAALSSAH